MSSTVPRGAPSTSLGASPPPKRCYDKCVPGEIDVEVREILKDGDCPGACTLAIRALGPQVLRYLGAILRDEEDTKDAFSRWAEGLWQGLPSFRWQSSLRTWAFRLAYHAALDLRAKAWRRYEARLESGAASKIAAEVQTSTAGRLERQRSILQELRQNLTQEDQALIELRVGQGLAWEEIAQVLARDGDTPDPGTVAKRFERLKARLAEMLRSEGIME